MRSILALFLLGLMAASCRDGHFQQKELEASIQGLEVQYLSAKSLGACPNEENCYRTQFSFLLRQRGGNSIPSQPIDIQILHPRFLSIESGATVTDLESRVDFIVRFQEMPYERDSLFRIGIAVSSPQWGSDFLCGTLAPSQTEENFEIEKNDCNSSSFKASTFIPAREYEWKIDHLFRMKPQHYRLQMSLSSATSRKPITDLELEWEIEGLDQKGVERADAQGRFALDFNVIQNPLLNQTPKQLHIVLRPQDQSDKELSVYLILDPNPDSPQPLIAYASEKFPEESYSSLPYPQQILLQDVFLEDGEEEEVWKLNENLKLELERSFQLRLTPQITQQKTNGEVTSLKLGLQNFWVEWVSPDFLTKDEANKEADALGTLSVPLKITSSHRQLPRLIPLYLSLSMPETTAAFELQFFSKTGRAASIRPLSLENWGKKRDSWGLQAMSFQSPSPEAYFSGCERANIHPKFDLIQAFLASSTAPAEPDQWKKFYAILVGGPTPLDPNKIPSLQVIDNFHWERLLFVEDLLTKRLEKTEAQPRLQRDLVQWILSGTARRCDRLNFRASESVPKTCLYLCQNDLENFESFEDNWYYLQREASEVLIRAPLPASLTPDWIKNNNYLDPANNQKLVPQVLRRVLKLNF